MKCHHCGQNKPCSQRYFYRDRQGERWRQPCRECYAARETERSRAAREADPYRIRALARARYREKLGRPVRAWVARPDTPDILAERQLRRARYRRKIGRPVRRYRRIA